MRYFPTERERCRWNYKEDKTIEILIAVLEVFWAMLCAIGNMIWQLIPAILDLLKIRGYFTPAGIIALQIGVPTFLVSAVIFLIRKAVFSR